MRLPLWLYVALLALFHVAIAEEETIEVIDIDAAAFGTDVLGTQSNWLLYFYMNEDTCPQCNAVEKVVAELAVELAEFGIKVGAVNMDTNMILAKDLRIPQPPSFLTVMGPATRNPYTRKMMRDHAPFTGRFSSRAVKKFALNSLTNDVKRIDNNSWGPLQADASTKELIDNLYPDLGPDQLLPRNISLLFTDREKTSPLYIALSTSEGLRGNMDFVEIYADMEDEAGLFTRFGVSVTDLPAFKVLTKPEGAGVGALANTNGRELLSYSGAPKKLAELRSFLLPHATPPPPSDPTKRGKGDRTSKKGEKSQEGGSSSGNSGSSGGSGGGSPFGEPSVLLMNYTTSTAEFDAQVQEDKAAYIVLYLYTSTATTDAANTANSANNANNADAKSVEAAGAAEPTELYTGPKEVSKVFAYLSSTFGLGLGSSSEETEKEEAKEQEKKEEGKAARARLDGIAEVQAACGAGAAIKCAVVFCTPPPPSSSAKSICDPRPVVPSEESENENEDEGTAAAVGAIAVEYLYGEVWPFGVTDKEDLGPTTFKPNPFGVGGVSPSGGSTNTDSGSDAASRGSPTGAGSGGSSAASVVSVSLSGGEMVAEAEDSIDAYLESSSAGVGMGGGMGGGGGGGAGLAVVTSAMEFEMALTAAVHTGRIPLVALSKQNEPNRLLRHLGAMVGGGAMVVFVSRPGPDIVERLPNIRTPSLLAMLPTPAEEAMPPPSQDPSSSSQDGKSAPPPPPPPQAAFSISVYDKRMFGPLSYASVYTFLKLLVPHYHHQFRTVQIATTFEKDWTGATGGDGVGGLGGSAGSAGDSSGGGAGGGGGGDSSASSGGKGGEGKVVVLSGSGSSSGSDKGKGKGKGEGEDEAKGEAKQQAKPLWIADICPPSSSKLCAIALLDGNLDIRTSSSSAAAAAAAGGEGGEVPEAEGRTRQEIDLFTTVRHKDAALQGYDFVVADAGCRPALAALFDSTPSDLPTVIAYSPKKQKYAKMVGAYTVENVRVFLRGVLKGAVPTIDLVGSAGAGAGVVGGGSSGGGRGSSSTGIARILSDPGFELDTICMDYRQGGSSSTGTGTDSGEGGPSGGLAGGIGVEDGDDGDDFMAEILREEEEAKQRLVEEIAREEAEAKAKAEEEEAKKKRKELLKKKKKAKAKKLAKEKAKKKDKEL